MKVGDKVKWLDNGHVEKVMIVNYIEGLCYLSGTGTWGVGFIKHRTVPYNTKYYYDSF